MDDLSKRILRNAGVEQNDTEPLQEGIGGKVLGALGLGKPKVGTMPRVPGSTPSGGNLGAFWGMFSTKFDNVYQAAQRFENERTRENQASLISAYQEIAKMNIPGTPSKTGSAILNFLQTSKKEYEGGLSGLPELERIADTLHASGIQDKLFSPDMGEDQLGTNSSETPMTTTPSMGEDKPEPAPVGGPKVPEQKKRDLPKRPGKRKDDLIQGAYDELNKQIWDNAEKSMRKPS